MRGIGASHRSKTVVTRGPGLRNSGGNNLSDENMLERSRTQNPRVSIEVPYEESELTFTEQSYTTNSP